MKDQTSTSAPVVPAHDASKYSIYKADRFTTDKTARKWGVAWIGKSLEVRPGTGNLLDCFGADGIEIPGLYFNKTSRRFIQY